MLTNYIRATMHRARYQVLPDDGSFYGEIPGFPGVWANAPTLEACRDALRAVLEEWIVVGLRLDHRLPVVDGLSLAVRLRTGGV